MPKVYNASYIERHRPGKGKEWQQIPGGGFIKVKQQPPFNPNEVPPPNDDELRRYESSVRNSGFLSRLLGRNTNAGYFAEAVELNKELAEKTGSERGSGESKG